MIYSRYKSVRTVNSMLAVFNDIENFSEIPISLKALRYGCAFSVHFLLAESYYYKHRARKPLSMKSVVG